MTGDGLARLTTALESCGYAVRGTSAQCPGPAHKNGDRNHSLSIRQGNGKAILRCHRNPPCTLDTILEMLGLSAADLSDEPRAGRRRDDTWTPHGPAVAVYDYTDEQGALLFQVCRTAGKEFPQRRPDPASPSGWRWNLAGTRRVLYRLPRILAAPDSACILLAEGEKDADALEAAGETATCNPGGAGKWRDEYAAPLTGRDVLIIADRDQPGRDHARQAAASLDGRARSCWIIEAAGDCKDAAAHLAAGYGILDFTWWDQL